MESAFIHPILLPLIIMVILLSLSIIGMGVYVIFYVRYGKPPDDESDNKNKKSWFPFGKKITKRVYSSNVMLVPWQDLIDLKPISLN